MNEEILQDKLEKYVRGQLPPAEAAALEREIAADPALQEQLRLHRLELESHEYLLRERLRQNVRTWVAEAPTEMPRPSVAGRKWGLPLLIVALLSVTGTWFFFQNREGKAPLQQPQEIREEKSAPIPSSETPIAETESQNETPAPRPERRYLALAQSAYKAPPNIGETMLKSDDPSQQGTDPLSLGIQAYQKGQYQAAIREFEKITPQNNPQQYSLARDWKAHTWFKIGLQSGDFKPSAKIFQSMAELKTGDVAQDRAEWFLVLCLVPDYQQNKKRVNSLLVNIIREEFHSYREDSEKMQQALRKTL